VKKGKKAIKIIVVICLCLLVLVRVSYKEEEIPYVFIGEEQYVFDGYTSYSYIPVEAYVYTASDRFDTHDLLSNVDFEELHNIDLSQTYVLVTYGRRIEQLHWSSAGTANFFHYGFAFGWKYLLFTFSETYYPDTAFFYLIDAESYIGYSNFSDSGDCYILVNNTERVYIGQWGDLSSRETVQNAIEKAEQSS